MNSMEKYLKIATREKENDFQKSLELPTKSTKFIGVEDDPIKTLDHYFSQTVVPRLAKLHREGKLTNLATCPLWTEVDRLWGAPSPDVEAVKKAMLRAVGTYEGSDG